MFDAEILKSIKIFLQLFTAVLVSICNKKKFGNSIWIFVIDT